MSTGHERARVVAYCLRRSAEEYARGNHERAAMASDIARAIGAAQHADIAIVEAQAARATVTREAIDAAPPVVVRRGAPTGDVCHCGGLMRRDGNCSTICTQCGQGGGGCG